MERPRRTKLSITNLLRRGVPKDFISNTVDDLDSYGSPEREETLDYIRNYINNLPSELNKNHGLFLYGSNGVGKSFIASLIIKEAYICRYTSRRCTFVDYVSKYTDLWKIKDKEILEEEEGLFYHNYKSVDFLVIEEIGKEIDSKISASVLEDLLRYREEHGLVTIICANLTPKEIVEKYGNSVGSLIKGNFTPIKLVGKDKRINSFSKKVGE